MSIETIGCANCAASGWFASALTNWEASPCDECGGTGRVPVLPAPREERYGPGFDSPGEETVYVHPGYWMPAKALGGR
jgi:hypothetical protein